MLFFFVQYSVLVCPMMPNLNSLSLSTLTLVSHSHSHPLLALGSNLVMIDFDLYFDLAYWLGEFL